jgi:hypothetical protein
MPLMPDKRIFLELLCQEGVEVIFGNLGPCLIYSAP